jgi:hypothetical protein
LFPYSLFINPISLQSNCEIPELDLPDETWSLLSHRDDETLWAILTFFSSIDDELHHLLYRPSLFFFGREENQIENNAFMTTPVMKEFSEVFGVPGDFFPSSLSLFPIKYAGFKYIKEVSLTNHGGSDQLLI